MWKWIKRLFRKKSRPVLVPIKTKPPTIILNADDNDMDCNQAGLDMICHFEGYYSKPYLCPANVPTIGIGTIVYPNGKHVALNDRPINLKEAKKYLLHELQSKEDTIERFLNRYGIKVNLNQFSALVSFGYNLGCDPITNPAKSLCKALKSGDSRLVCKAIMLYNKARVRNKFGIKRLKVLKGLDRRRKAECKLYMKA